MRLTLLAAALFALSACAGGEDGHGGSSAPDAATGFITENSIAPESATNTHGDDVLLDDDGRPYGYGLLGARLPDFTAPMVSGGEWSPRRIDSWTIVYVWGLWCDDCIADAPHAAELAALAKAEPGLDFISIHTPPNARRADEAFGRYDSVEAYFEAVGYSYPTVLDIDASLSEMLQIAWTPTYLLVSPDGVVRGFRTDLSVAGDTPVDDFMANVRKVQAATFSEFRPALPDFGFDGVAGITGTTPFTQGSIEVAFSPLIVRAHTESMEGDSYPVFRVIEPGMPPRSRGNLYTIEPDWDRGHVLAVVTRNRGVVGPYDSKVGTSLLGDLPERARQACGPGLEAYADHLVCTVDAGKGARFAWVFAAPDTFEGDFTTASAEIQAKGQLQEMRYLPPSPARMSE
ncbi:MAG: TlpA family protein disulfide reductase [Hyphomonadaceae bacterium]|nr:TlpA family protein disulfide reductase [Hyphomonadaceae bacterium]